MPPCTSGQTLDLDEEMLCLQADVAKRVEAGATDTRLHMRGVTELIKVAETHVSEWNECKDADGGPNKLASEVRAYIDRSDHPAAVTHADLMRMCGRSDNATDADDDDNAGAASIDRCMPIKSDVDLVAGDACAVVEPVGASISDRVDVVVGGRVRARSLPPHVAEDYAIENGQSGVIEDFHAASGQYLILWDGKPSGSAGWVEATQGLLLWLTKGR